MSLDETIAWQCEQTMWWQKNSKKYLKEMNTQGAKWLPKHLNLSMIKSFY